MESESILSLSETLNLATSSGNVFTIASSEFSRILSETFLREIETALFEIIEGLQLQIKVIARRSLSIYGHLKQFFLR